MKQEEEEVLAVGGVYTNRAGCLLLPFVPIKAAYSMAVTSKRIVLDPILHYRLLTRRMVFGLEEVEGAEASGSSVELSLWSVVSVGMALSLHLKGGRVHSFRSTTAQQLAEAINEAVRRFRG